MRNITTQQSFTDDWRRTDPDLAVYLPTESPDYAESVDMSLVDYTPGGDLLAVWTWATKPGGVDHSIAYARSTDGGINWTAPGIIDGPGPKHGQESQRRLPICAPGSLRIRSLQAVGASSRPGTEVFDVRRGPRSCAGCRNRRRDSRL